MDSAWETAAAAQLEDRPVDDVRREKSFFGARLSVSSGGPQVSKWRTSSPRPNARVLRGGCSCANSTALSVVTRGTRPSSIRPKYSPFPGCRLWYSRSKLFSTGSSHPPVPPHETIQAAKASTPNRLARRAWCSHRGDPGARFPTEPVPNRFRRPALVMGVARSQKLFLNVDRRDGLSRLQPTSHSRSWS